MNMEMYEAAVLLKFSHLAHKSEYECARLGAYVTAQCNSTKKLKPTDICRFGWESDGNAAGKLPERREDTREDLRRLSETARDILKSINDTDNPQWR